MLTWMAGYSTRARLAPESSARKRQGPGITARALPSAWRSGRDDDRLDDHVGDGLPLGGPQREQVADEADDAVNEVADVADERHQRSDRLPGLLAHELEVQHLL